MLKTVCVPTTVLNYYWQNLRPIHLSHTRLPRFPCGITTEPRDFPFRTYNSVSFTTVCTQIHFIYFFVHMWGQKNNCQQLSVHLCEARSLRSATPCTPVSWSWAAGWFFLLCFSSWDTNMRINSNCQTWGFFFCNLGVLPACMSVHHLQRPEEGTQCLGPGIKGGSVVSSPVGAGIQQPGPCLYSWTDCWDHTQVAWPAQLCTFTCWAISPGFTRS